MKNATNQLIETLRTPGLCSRYSPQEWTRLISVARSANLLGSLGNRLLNNPECVVLPEARRHLLGMLQLSERQHESVRWEVSQLARSLEHLGIPVLLLKGAAYVLGNLPVSHGRIFGDIDILVPQSALGDVEIAMMTHGWTSTKHDEYDQRYYRQWMHELPPMVNVNRGTVLDIHHTLLPLTSRHHPDPQKLIDASNQLPGLLPLRIPMPQDLIIHSITHLFHEGELHNGLRDLFDIDSLLRHFAATIPDFWNTLLDRAEQLHLGYPVFLGLHFSSHLLETPIPAEILQSASSKHWPPPITVRRKLLQWLYEKGLQPIHSECDEYLTPIARRLLYVRAHWLRMPPHLLARHLSRKAWKNLFPNNGPTTAAPETDLLNQ